MEYLALKLAPDAHAAWKTNLPPRIPPCLLEGLEVATPECGEVWLAVLEASTLVNSTAAKTSLRTVAWLPPNEEGVVSEAQWEMARLLNPAVVFCGDTAAPCSMHGIPVIRIANYPGRLTTPEQPEEKVIPLGLAGSGFLLNVSDSLLNPNNSPEFPWRAAITAPLLQTFPCYSASETASPIHDDLQHPERTRCQIAVLCGGKQKRFSPLFLELLLHEACLVTERSPVLEEMGIRDGVNAVFAQPSDVITKCAALLSNEGTRRSIATEGRNLALHILQTSGRGALRTWIKSTERAPTQHGIAGPLAAPVCSWLGRLSRLSRLGALFSNPR